MELRYGIEFADADLSKVSAPALKTPAQTPAAAAEIKHFLETTLPGAPLTVETDAQSKFPKAPAMILAPKESVPAETRQKLAQELALFPETAEIIYRRGHLSVAAAQRFILADQRLTPLEQLKGAPEFIDCLVTQTIIGGQKTALFFDYDVDGISAAFLLFAAIKGLNPHAHLDLMPSQRFSVGYGTSLDKIEAAAAQGCKVAVLMDFGSQCHAQIARARELGLIVLVLDHHNLGATLPAANAFINPCQSGCGFHGLGYSTGALALRIAEGLKEGVLTSPVFSSRRVEFRRRAEELELEDLSMFAAFSAICDIVPLTGDVRAIVRRGLQAFNLSHAPLVRVLKEMIKKPLIDAGDVGFQIGPRINAAARLEDGGAQMVFDLLRERALSGKRDLAEELNQYNLERRRVSAASFKLARELIESLPDLPAAIVLAHQDFHPGVAGIVAAQVMAQYHRPVFIFHINPDGLYQGSGRCIDSPHLDLARALADPRVSRYLTKAGGHQHAAGASTTAEMFPEARAALNLVISEQGLSKDLSRRLQTDLELTIKRINELGVDFVYELTSVFEPCGEGNPAPLILIRDAAVTSNIPVSSLRPASRRIRIRQGAEGADNLPCLFQPAFLTPGLEEGRRVNLAVRLKIQDRNALFNLDRQRPLGEIVDFEAAK